MRIEKGRCDKRFALLYFLIYVKKPSLGRVAVSVIYLDGNRESEDVKRQCNWHILTSFPEVWQTACRYAAPWRQLRHRNNFSTSCGRMQLLSALPG
jgi:hypothetical protein